MSAVCLMLAWPMAGAAAALEHTVVKGDSLWSLAKEFYHDPGRWRTIAEANKGGPCGLRTGSRRAKCS